MITKVSNCFALDKANGLQKVYKVPKLMEVDGCISLHYQLLSYQGKQMQCWVGHQV